MFGVLFSIDGALVQVSSVQEWYMCNNIVLCYL